MLGFLRLLGNPSEHGERNGSFDVVVGEDGRGDRINYHATYVGILREQSDLLDLLRKNIGGGQLVNRLHVIGFDGRWKYRKAILDVQEIIILVGVDARHCDFIPRTGHVDVIPLEDHFLVSGYSARGNCPRSLLDSQFLVIAINRVLVVDFKRAGGLADSACSQFHLL